MAHAGHTESRGTDANPSAASASNSPLASSTMPRSAVERGQTGAPHGLVDLARGHQLEHRRDLAQAALLAADGEHLQAVHAGVERGVVGRAEGVGALGGGLGLVEAAGGQLQHHLEGPAHELERGVAPAGRHLLCRAEDGVGLVEAGRT